MNLVKVFFCSAFLVVMTSCNAQQSTTQPTQPTGSSSPTQPVGTNIAFKDVKVVIDAKCVVCHSMTPAADSGYRSPAGGVSFDNQSSISSMANQINRQINRGAMPPANSNYKLSDQEKTLINTWISQGASQN